ncbi:MAG: gliding motility-associated C-terminal domain-containing protein, partial [Bacteroidota bacterium]|nr:gliding motility-associated C-terminal domain-containing protein [Bacteroidota bacterium]
TGIGYPFLWEDNVNDTLENVIPLYFDDESDYSVSFLFDEFATDALYSAGGIDSVGIELEHSDMGQVSVSMSCPNGTTVLLKDFSASNHADLGVPVEDPDPESGTGWLYYWSASSVNGIMNDAVDNPIPEADYSPEDSFDAFVGCPLNGEWTITLTDNTPDDDGFVFSQEIIFSESIEPPLWTYADTLLSYTGVWTGAGNPVTQIQTLENGGVKGIALATPETYGNNPYNYIVFTNWGCKTDTIVGLPVEKPVMTVEPESGQAELDVSLASDTPWAEINSWELGDDTPDLAGQEVTHTYMEKGTYEIVLTATDNKDCTDTDTATIEVSVEPSQLTVPNFFSPDDNGINDILTLDIEGMEDFNFSVYSRWGQNVFSTSDEDEAKAGWDGRMSLTNLKASPGVYFFVFKGTGKDGKEWEEKGSIHLAR